MAAINLEELLCLAVRGQADRLDLAVNTQEGHLSMLMSNSEGLQGPLGLVVINQETYPDQEELKPVFVKASLACSRNLKRQCQPLEPNEVNEQPNCHLVAPSVTDRVVACADDTFLAAVAFWLQFLLYIEIYFLLREFLHF